MREWVLKKRSIWFHIIVAYFTCGLWLIVYLFCRLTNSQTKKQNITFNEYANEYIPYGDTTLDNYYMIQKKYEFVLNEHYKNIEKINMLYTIANNLSLPNSKEMQQVIDLCIKDIDLAPKILNYCKELADNYNDNLENHLINYVSFQRLAIIYEKQKEYQKAIEVCQQAIQLGFYKDGSTGQMPGRLARLIKKANKEKAQLKEK